MPVERSAEHTSLYAEPSYYAMLFDGREDDQRFYAAVCDGADEVLEYGIGGGRIGVPLARRGHCVYGVELESAMLEQLAQRIAHERDDVRARVIAHLGDARSHSFGRSFTRVICPFNGLAHFVTEDDLAAFFARVREHLAPRGRFAFDVWLPNPTLLAGTTTHTPWFEHPRTGRRVRCVEKFEYDPIAQVLSTSLEIQPEGATRPIERLGLRLRQFFPEETRALLARHGLSVVFRTSQFARPDETCGDHLPFEPADRRGEMLAYVCALAGAP